MKRNEEKFHELLSTDETLQVKIGAALIKSSKCKKVLGVKIDNKSMFDEHRIICKKASAKFNASSRVAKYMCPEKRRFIMNVFFSAQFNYCFLIWMFHNQQTFATRPMHAVNYGSNYLGPKIWEMVPSDVKNLGTVKAFKFVIKRWLPETTFVDSANGMSTKLAFCEFFTCFSRLTLFM